MSDNAQGGGGTPASGNGAGNADVNELINQVVGKRVKKAMEKAMESLRGDLMSVVKEAMGQKPAEKPPTDQPAANGNNADSAERLTMKALQERFESETKAINAKLKAAEEARAQAEAKAKDVSMRAQVRSQLESKLGSGNPAVDLLMDSLYDVKKRFVEENGQLGVKFSTAWGEDEVKPLNEGIAALFDSELKHFVPENKSRNLPSTGLNGLRGMPQMQQPPLAKGTQLPEFMQTIAQHLAQHGDAEKAQGLLNSFAAQTQKPEPAK